MWGNDSEIKDASEIQVVLLPKNEYKCHEIEHK